MQDTTPKSILEHMMEDFTKNTQGLFTVTHFPEMVNGEKAIYGKIIIKPSKRVARLLTIDREVLVLFSNFEDQQVRTITQSKKIINELQPRVESTVVIIVHKEKTANNKLKKWGRENGLTVLPIFHIDNSFPHETELEKILLGELYSHDPFDITGPVSDDSQFYGRRTEAQDLARKLSAGQIKSCLGIRKIGKTSLLNRVISELRNYHDAICIVIDCSKDAIWDSNAKNLLNSICEAIKLTTTNNELYYSINEVKKTAESKTIANLSKKISDELNKIEKPIIIFFDEIDYITPSSPTTNIWKEDFNIFWRNLRAIYQDNKRLNDNLGIFICGVSSKWFTIDSINGIENAALSFVPEEYLSPLTRGASIPMIKTLARTSGLLIEENVASYIADFCCDIPFWIRKACSYIHKNVSVEDRPLNIDLLKAQNLLNCFLTDEGSLFSQVALKHLIRVYPEIKEIIIKYYENKGSALSPILFNKLPKYGIVNQQGGKYVFGTMMESGIANIINDDTQEKDSTKAIVNEEFISTKKITDNVDEWADELAVLGRGRNILEKKMRQICVNFIRYDSLINTSKGTLNERLLKVIEEKSRKNYKNLSPEQIMDKFLWSDLTKLIMKEWKLFERLFIDKNEFNLNSLTINERPDAHAKDFKIEDVALYKRALAWFEDKLRVSS